MSYLYFHLFNLLFSLIAMFHWIDVAVDDKRPPMPWFAWFGPCKIMGIFWPLMFFLQLHLVPMEAWK